MKKFNLLLLVVLGISVIACDDEDEYRGDWAKGVSFEGEPRTGAVSFVINNVAYVGTGFVAAFSNPSQGIERKREFLNDFYKFDGTTQTWTQIADFPGKGRRDAVAFSIGGYGYVGTGRGFGEAGSVAMPFKDFWRYDPNADKWEPVSYDGAARYGALAFVIDGAAHVCLGMEDDANAALDHYKFIPTANGSGEWKKMQALTDKPKNRQDALYNRIPRTHAVAFIAENDEEEKEYAYIATGSNQYTWWYDHKRDIWHEVEDLPVRTSGAPNVRQAVAFSINGRGYFTTGSTSYDGDGTAQTWYYIPGVKEDRGNDY